MLSVTTQLESLLHREDLDDGSIGSHVAASQQNLNSLERCELTLSPDCSPYAEPSSIDCRTLWLAA